MRKLESYELDVPGFFNPTKVEQPGWFVDYNGVDAAAVQTRKQRGVRLAATDKLKMAVLAIDIQQTFCFPSAQLYVGGRSGTGAIDDSRRTCEFVYRNGRLINKIHPTLDTHLRAQIFHPAFWVNEQGEHPAPNITCITYDDVKNGVWRANTAVAASVLKNASAGAYLQSYALHYVKTLSDDGKYPLLIWTYHSMLGGTEHALVPAVHEAFFYQNALRESETQFEVKGGTPLAEFYAITHPEVTTDQRGKSNGANKNSKFIKTLLENDMVVIFGQAKSHCVAWSIQGLLDDIAVQDPQLAAKVYLVEDLCSPVVIPGVASLDFTDAADAAFDRFRNAGMNVVKSTDPVHTWGGVAAEICDQAA
jgi:nicotinamidase-related amidase